jgi:hypothetical protein
LRKDLTANLERFTSCLRPQPAEGAAGARATAPERLTVVPREDGTWHVEGKKTSLGYSCTGGCGRS